MADGADTPVVTTGMPLRVRLFVLGEQQCGKSTLLARWVSGAALASVRPPLPTIGMDFTLVKLPLDVLSLATRTHLASWSPLTSHLRLEVWDTAGDPRFRHAGNSHFHGAHGALVVYDVTNRRSFEAVPEHVQRFRSHQRELPIALVGTKADDGGAAGRREVSAAEAQALAADEGLLFAAEASARDGPFEAVAAVFTQLAAKAAEGVVSTDRDAHQTEQMMLHRSSGRAGFGGIAKPRCAIQ